MRKFSILAVLITCSLISCRNERFDMDLLYGSWIRLPDTGHPSPTIEFNIDGTYWIVGYQSVPTGGVTVYRLTITGEFEVGGYYVTLVTAEVQSMDEEPDPGGFPYEGIDITEGISIGSFYGGQNSLPSRTGISGAITDNTEYIPVTWELLDLTESLLEVKVALDTVRYVRQ
jgi:hypothetical protein